MNGFTCLLRDILSYDPKVRKAAKEKYLNMPSEKKISCISVYPKITPHPRFSEMEEQVIKLATILYCCLQEDTVDIVYPKVPITERSMFGRKMRMYHYLNQHYDHMLTIWGVTNQSLEYKIFNEMVGVTEALLTNVKPFLRSILEDKFVLPIAPMLSEAIESTGIQLDSQIHLFVKPITLCIRNVLQNNGPMSVSSATLPFIILNVCSGLLLRQLFFFNDLEVIDAFTGIVRNAISVIATNMRQCNYKQAISSFVRVPNFQFVCLITHRPVIFQPVSHHLTFAILEILSISDPSMNFMKKCFLDVFATFAENFPADVKQATESCYLPMGSDTPDPDNPWQTRLVNGIIDIIDTCTVDCDDTCNVSLCLLGHKGDENALTNFERLANVLDADKIWSVIYQMLNFSPYRSNTVWTREYSLLMIISFLSSACKTQIRDNIDLVMGYIKDESNFLRCCKRDYAICHVIGNLCLELGNDFLKEWQDDFLITVLLRSVRCPEGDECISTANIAIRALDICSSNCLTPSLVNNLSDVMESLEERLTPNEAFFEDNLKNLFAQSEMKEYAMEAFCTIARTAKSHCQLEMVDKFWIALDLHVFRHRSGGFYNIIQKNKTFFRTLLQLYQHDGRPVWKERIISYINRALEKDGRDWTNKLFYYISAAVLSVVPQSFLPELRDVVLRNLQKLIDFAAMESLEYFRRIILEYLPDLEHCDIPPIADILKQKEYVCQALLNIAKCKGFLPREFVPKVIDAMLVNLEDTIIICTQTTAAQALPILLATYKETDASPSLQDRILSAFITVAERNNAKVRSLHILKEMEHVIRIIGIRNLKPSVRSHVKVVFQRCLEAPDTIVDEMRTNESFGAFTKKKSAMMKDRVPLIYEIQSAVSSLFSANML